MTHVFVCSVNLFLPLSQYCWSETQPFVLWAKLPKIRRCRKKTMTHSQQGEVTLSWFFMGNLISSHRTLATTTQALLFPSMPACKWNNSCCAVAEHKMALDESRELHKTSGQEDGSLEDSGPAATVPAEAQPPPRAMFISPRTRCERRPCTWPAEVRLKSTARASAGDTTVLPPSWLWSA